MNLDKELLKYKGFTEKYAKKISVSLDNQVEAEISKRINELGVDINDKDYIQHNFEFIECDGDEFKHLFYKPQNKFIFSIQKLPEINIWYDGDDFINNKVTCTATYKYY